MAKERHFVMERQNCSKLLLHENAKMQIKQLIWPRLKEKRFRNLPDSFPLLDDYLLHFLLHDADLQVGVVFIMYFELPLCLVFHVMNCNSS